MAEIADDGFHELGDLNRVEIHIGNESAIGQGAKPNVVIYGENYDTDPDDYKYMPFDVYRTKIIQYRDVILFPRFDAAKNLLKMPDDIFSRMKTAQTLEDLVVEATLAITQEPNKYRVGMAKLKGHMNKVTWKILAEAIEYVPEDWFYGESVDALYDVKENAPDEWLGVKQKSMSAMRQLDENVADMDPDALRLFVDDYDDLVGWVADENGPEYRDDAMGNEIREQLAGKAVVEGRLDDYSEEDLQNEDIIDQYELGIGWINTFDRLTRENDSGAMINIVSTHPDSVVWASPEIKTKMLTEYGEESDALLLVCAEIIDDAETLSSTLATWMKGLEKRDPSNSHDAMEKFIEALYIIESKAGVQKVTENAIKFMLTAEEGLWSKYDTARSQATAPAVKKLMGTGNPYVIKILQDILSPNESDLWVDRNISDDMKNEMDAIPPPQPDPETQPELFTDEELGVDATWFDRALVKEARLLLELAILYPPGIRLTS